MAAVQLEPWLRALITNNNQKRTIYDGETKEQSDCENLKNGSKPKSDLCKKGKFDVIKKIMP
jgi:hypothetical protein